MICKKKVLETIKIFLLQKNSPKFPEIGIHHASWLNLPIQNYFKKISTLCALIFANCLKTYIVSFSHT